MTLRHLVKLLLICSAEHGLEFKALGRLFELDFTMILPYTIASIAGHLPILTCLQVLHNKNKRWKPYGSAATEQSMIMKCHW